ncbi:putative multicopper oxidase, type 1, partial [Aureobasidium melanogenum]
MRLALDEARKSPPKPTNYCVGAVLVSPSSPEPILATGYTLELEGNTHAEQCCLGKLARTMNISEEHVGSIMPDDTVLYTTMEPCDFRLSGNLPCTERVLLTRSSSSTGHKGIQKVYIGVKEPEKFVGENKGRRKLEDAGIPVIHVEGLEHEILKVATAVASCIILLLVLRDRDDLSANHRAGQSEAVLTSHGRVHHTKLHSCVKLTFAMAPSGRLPFHLSWTFVILPPSWKMLTTEEMVCSIPTPLTFKNVSTLITQRDGTATHPLCLVLLATFSNGDGVLENTLILPKLQLLETRTTSKKVKNTSHQCLLLTLKSDSRSSLDVGVFNVKTRRHGGGLCLVKRLGSCELKSCWSAEDVGSLLNVARTSTKSSSTTSISEDLIMRMLRRSISHINQAELMAHATARPNQVDPNITLDLPKSPILPDFPIPKKMTETRPISKDHCRFEGILIVLFDSMNWTPRPSEMCHAMWQCMSQTPGLFAGKAIKTQPRPGRMVRLSQGRRSHGLDEAELTIMAVCLGSVLERHTETGQQPGSRGVSLLSVGLAAVTPDCLGAEEVVARSLVGSEDNIVALTNGNQDPILVSQRLGGNEVSSNDSEVVAIKLDTDGIIDRGVDQTQAMSLARGKGHLSIRSGARGTHALAIDKDVITVWWRRIGLKVVESDVVDSGCETVVPIADRQRTKINVIVGGSGTVDDNRASNTHTTANTIRAHAIKLSDTVPMETAAIVRERVLDVDDDLVAPISSNNRARLLAVDQEALDSTIAVRVTSCVCDLKVVGHGVPCDRMLLIEFGPLVQAASATNEVEEEDETLLDAAFDDADDTDEAALDVDDALLLVEELVARRTILPIRSTIGSRLVYILPRPNAPTASPPHSRSPHQVTTTSSSGEKARGPYHDLSKDQEGMQVSGNLRPILLAKPSCCLTVRPKAAMAWCKGLHTKAVAVNSSYSRRSRHESWHVLRSEACMAFHINTTLWISLYHSALRQTLIGSSCANRTLSRLDNEQLVAICFQGCRHFATGRRTHVANRPLRPVQILLFPAQDGPKRFFFVLLLNTYDLFEIPSNAYSDGIRMIEVYLFPSKSGNMIVAFSLDFIARSESPHEVRLLHIKSTFLRELSCHRAFYRHVETLKICSPRMKRSVRYQKWILALVCLSCAPYARLISFRSFSSSIGIQASSASAGLHPSMVR